MDANILQNILKKHSLWLNSLPGGERAILVGADLQGAILAGANLVGAILRNANLAGVNLAGANLAGADLRNADLKGADLAGVNLVGAILRNADLEGADLAGANLVGAILPVFQICPEEEFIGWKKVSRGFILKLLIKGERTSSLVGRKCRCSEALVLAAFDAGEELKEGFFCSKYDSSFAYSIGMIVKEPAYNPDIRLECTTGIHFFITRKEAEQY